MSDVILPEPVVKVTSPDAIPTLYTTMEAVSKWHFRRVWDHYGKTRNKHAKVARTLGIGRITVYRMIKRWGIE